MKWIVGGDGKGEKEMSNGDTPGRGRGREDVVQYNISGLRSTGFDYTTRSKRGSWIVVFHAATLLDLEREVGGVRLRVWITVFLVALAERLGGGGGVASSGDKEELTDKTSTSNFSVRSLT